MLHVSVYGEHTLSIQSISRLLQDNEGFNVHAITSYSEYKQVHNKQDILIYCAIGYSTNLFNEIRALHKHTPTVKKILIMPMAHKQFLLKMLAAGVEAIISYKAPIEELIQAIHLTQDGQQYLSVDLSQMVIKNQYPSNFNTLSKRELEITYMLANGMNIKSVSSELAISPKTVNTYRYRIFNKLEIGHDIDLFRMVSEDAAYMLA